MLRDSRQYTCFVLDTTQLINTSSQLLPLIDNKFNFSISKAFQAYKVHKCIVSPITYISSFSDRHGQLELGQMVDIVSVVVL